MKKILLKTIIALLCFACLPFAAFGCNSDGGTADFITADAYSWKNKYFVGEQIDLNYLYVLYYPDVEKIDEYDKIPATDTSKVTIVGFDTSTVGKMKITLKYKNLQTTEVDYEVFEDVAFSVNKTIYLGNNVIASLDSSTQKATIKKYDSLAKLLSEDGTTSQVDFKPTMASDMDGDPIKVGKFVFENVTYTYSQTGYIIRTQTDGTYTNTTTYKATEYNKEKIALPTFDVEYVSQVENGKKAIAIFSSDYSLKVYVVDENVDDVTSLTPDATFLGTIASLSTSGIINYVNHVDGQLKSMASLTNQTTLDVQIKLTSYYSFTCTKTMN